MPSSFTKVTEDREGKPLLVSGFWDLASDFIWLRDRAEIRPAAAAQCFPGASGSGRRPAKQTARASAQAAAGTTERGFSACFHPGAAQR
jgi:hypothetical protein